MSPNAVEICDGFDTCDGEIDEGVTQTFFADKDGDGFGNQMTSWRHVMFWKAMWLVVMNVMMKTTRFSCG